jgi:hypothetical protein
MFSWGPDHKQGREMMANMVGFRRLNMQFIGDDPTIEERFNNGDDSVGTCCSITFDGIPSMDDVKRACVETKLQFFFKGKDPEFILRDTPREDGNWDVQVLNGLMTREEIGI